MEKVVPLHKVGTVRNWRGRTATTSLALSERQDVQLATKAASRNSFLFVPSLSCDSSSTPANWRSARNRYSPHHSTAQCGRHGSPHFPDSHMPLRPRIILLLSIPASSLPLWIEQERTHFDDRRATLLSVRQFELLQRTKTTSCISLCPASLTCLSTNPCFASEIFSSSAPNPSFGGCSLNETPTACLYRKLDRCSLSYNEQ